MPKYESYAGAIEGILAIYQREEGVVDHPHCDHYDPFEHFHPFDRAFCPNALLLCHFLMGRESLGWGR